MPRNERKLTLAEAAASCPTKPHIASVWRWCRKGIKTSGGGRVRLEHVRIGGRIYTTGPAMERFFAAVAAADLEHFRDDDTTLVNEGAPGAKQPVEALPA